MRTIFKYPLSRERVNDITTTRDGIPRRVAMQDGQVCMWVEVETNTRSKNRQFQIVGTGHPIPDNGHYIGTCDDGPFVWHVIELIG